MLSHTDYAVLALTPRKSNVYSVIEYGQVIANQNVHKLAVNSGPDHVITC